jgi:endonuclease/exonuclease/phosphatase family metal-dependent hydrolase
MHTPAVRFRTTPVVLLLVVGAGCARPSNLFVAPDLSACAGSAVASSLRVVTWNIRAGLSSSIDQIGDDLAALRPDVVALQEVDRDAERTGDVDQAAVLAERLGMTSTFAAARTEGHGDFGVALLSRLPFARAERIALPSDNAFEPRVALDAHVCAGDAEVRAVSVHADIYPWSAKQNAEALAHEVKDSVGSGVVVAGDLNGTPDAAGPAAFLDRGLVDTSADGPTCASRRIDYVFVDHAVGAIADAVVADTGDHSDHKAVVVDLLR